MPTANIGTFRFEDHSDAFLTEQRKHAMTGLFIAADETAGDVKERILRGPKTGKTYKKYKPHKRTHRASAPGEYPANDLAVLANSIGAERDDEAAYIITTAPHGRHLELKRGSGRRPHISRGVIENTDRINDITTAYIQKQQKK